MIFENHSLLKFEKDLTEKNSIVTQASKSKQTFSLLTGLAGRVNLTNQAY